MTPFGHQIRYGAPDEKLPGVRMVAPGNAVPEGAVVVSDAATEGRSTGASEAAAGVGTVA